MTQMMNRTETQTAIVAARQLVYEGLIVEDNHMPNLAMEAIWGGPESNPIG
jgi:hypothetical protein